MAKKYSIKAYWEFVRLFGQFKADYENIGSESADLIERIINLFKADNPNFKEQYFREKIQQYREQQTQ